MNKPVLGLVLGAILGVLDGLSALISAPEVAPEILTIVIGSTFKGVIAGVAIGWFAKKVNSLPAGIVPGLAVGAALAWLVATTDGRGYHLEMMLPGSVLGIIVGFATQRYGIRPGAAASLMALLFLPMSASAQAGMPPGWHAVPDRPSQHVAAGIPANDGEQYSFVVMAPGWHVTTGPGVVVFEESLRAANLFRLEGDFFLFPNPSDQPVGIFIGGSNLPSAGSAEWTGLVVRRDGTAAVIHRAVNGDLHPIVPWAATDSLAAHPDTTTQRIALAIDVLGDSVRFFVNRQRLGAVARGSIVVDGHFGLRIGQQLNLHVVRLDYTHRLATVPRSQGGE